MKRKFIVEFAVEYKPTFYLISVSPFNSDLSVRPSCLTVRFCTLKDFVGFSHCLFSHVPHRVEVKVEIDIVNCGIPQT